MAGVSNPNLPSFTLSATAVTERNAQYPGDPFDDVDGDGSYNTYLGMNRGGCAPGIGINTSFIDPKLSDWSILDQAGDARVPQDSSHIGGVNAAVVPGGELEDPPVPNFTPAVIPINAVLDRDEVTNDYDDTLSYITALAQAAPGVGFGAANADPINRTDVTIEIGDVAWGTNDVP